MADIIITIPNASLTRIVDGICGIHNYTQAIEDNPSPPTRNQFAKTVLIDTIKHWIKTHELNEVQKTNAVTINSEIDEISIT